MHLKHIAGALYALILSLGMALGTGAEAATCTPSSAPAQSFGCMPLQSTLIPGDTIPIWQPDQFPASNRQSTFSTLIGVWNNTQTVTTNTATITPGVTLVYVNKASGSATVLSLPTLSNFPSCGSSGGLCPGIEIVDLRGDSAANPITIQTTDSSTIGPGPSPTTSVVLQSNGGSLTVSGASNTVWGIK